MNILLSLNKKFFLIISYLIFLIIIFLISLVYYQSNTASTKNININNETADITKPRFSINSSKQKISVTANKGNFLTEDEIVLEKNVIFKSNKFKIFSENVLFNKKNLVATSKYKSRFIAKNASINSNGFEIIENGNIINFKGKTKLILK